MEKSIRIPVSQTITQYYGKYNYDESDDDSDLNEEEEDSIAVHQKLGSQLYSILQDGLTQEIVGIISQYSFSGGVDFGSDDWIKINHKQVENKTYTL
ncbi:unnamed protein product [Rhizophagus irregularis]|nr:unnamed protein product [Rhizophagus irregularis]